jgi:hypothetical protein
MKQLIEKLQAVCDEIARTTTIKSVDPMNPPKDEDVKRFAEASELLENAARLNASKVDPKAIVKIAKILEGVEEEEEE